ncbi:hypothetical protein [Oceanobacillus kapialis]|uniref:Uncharacterized protein n=1 Tax=Oceanobacillus kapialis TaxID=481353 RepID=A0ABW5Q1Z7_9BACI
MSERKQVIHVKDLVIRADNVYIEPSRPHHRNPFFGGRRQEEAEVEAHHKGVDEEEAFEDEKKDREERRDPFAWF